MDVDGNDAMSAQGFGSRQPTTRGQIDFGPATVRERTRIAMAAVIGFYMT